MSEEKNYSILFILDNNIGEIKHKFAEICRGLIKDGHEVHVIYPSIEVDEEFELSLSKVAWIHIYKLPFRSQFRLSQLEIPITIRRYIQRHDGVDIIHSFGLNCGILGYLSSIGFKTKTINTPDEIQANNANAKPHLRLRKFAVDNITYIFNRLCNKVLFFSSTEKEKATGHISYKNIKSELINISESQELNDKILQVYNA